MNIRQRVRAVFGIPQLNQRLDRQRAIIDEHQRELARVAPQVAALEARLAALTGASPATPDLESALDRAEAGDSVPADLLEAIRAEHARVRARVSAAARYEERLRRVEEKLAHLDR